MPEEEFPPQREWEKVGDQGLSEPRMVPCGMMQDKDVVAPKGFKAHRLYLTVPYLRSAWVTVLELLMAQYCL